MDAANTIGLGQTRQKPVARMKNAPKKVVPAWIAAKTKNAVRKMAQTRWSAVKMANALRKVMMGKIAAKKKVNLNSNNLISVV